MLDYERISSIVYSTEKIVEFGIPGAIVECGVWRGGSMMAVALALCELGIKDRELCLFDTFEGMTPPEEVDVDFHGEPASNQFKPGWCAVSTREVKENMASTGYPMKQVRFVQGRVEDTIPKESPSEIALLLLDTDWYASTKHEMEHLFPRVRAGGAAIIDDYGHWAGSRKATDEHMKKNSISTPLIHCGYTAVLLVKEEEHVQPERGR